MANLDNNSCTACSLGHAEEVSCLDDLTLPPSTKKRAEINREIAPRNKHGACELPLDKLDSPNAQDLVG